MSVARGPAPFLGREAELEHLGLALARAGRGQGQLVAVAGEAGAGKTRLLREFTREAGARGWRILWSEASPDRRLASSVRPSSWARRRRARAFRPAWSRRSGTSPRAMRWRRPRC